MRRLAPLLALSVTLAVAPACAADETAEQGAAGPTATAGATGPADATRSATPDSTSRRATAPHAGQQPARVPALRVRRVVTGLDNPWDVKRIPGGTWLITERDRARLSAYSGGERTTVRFPRRKVWVSGETGLMSLEVDPRFRRNHRFYTCSGWNRSDNGHDVRVNAWRLNRRETRARHLDTLVKGFPTSSGRHGGCRLLIDDDGSLLVGTGDAAEGTNPENLRSLGGKTLRLNRRTGKPWPDNPFVDAHNEKKRYVHTYGHRNVQGLAQRRNGQLWSVEHGPDRDDEVNLLRNGGDYGWNPVDPDDSAGYDESVPMTDQDLPGDQIAAKWSSGSPTLATSGAAFVYGRRWGRLDGTLAVAALKANRVVFMKFGRHGALKWTRAPRPLRQLGRVRSVTLLPHRDLLVTTDNDGGTDAVIRVHPRG